MKYLWKYLAHREIWLLFGTLIFVSVVTLRGCIPLFGSVAVVQKRRKRKVLCGVCSRIIVERS